MNRNSYLFFVTLFIFSTLCLTTANAQRVSPWHLATLEGHTGEILNLKFSPDHATLASGSDDGTIRLWDTATGQHKATLEGHTWGVTSLAFSKDSSTLASAADTEVWVWDVATGHRKAAFDEHTDEVTGIALNANGTVLASSSLDTTVRVWNVVNGTHSFTLEHSKAVIDVDLNPRGRTVASVSDAVYLWDATSGKEKGKISGSNVLSLAFSSTGRTLVTGHSDRWIRLWDVAAQQHKVNFASLGNRVTSVSFSADGRKITGGDISNNIVLWDVISENRSGNKITEFVAPSEVLSLALTAVGTILASAGTDWSVQLWDTTDGRFKGKISGSNVLSLASRTKGSTLVTGHSDRWIRLWDVAAQQHKVNFASLGDQVTSVSFSADGRRIAGGDISNNIILWDVISENKSGNKITEFVAPSEVLSLALNAESTILASAGTDENIRLWDTTNGKQQKVFEGHTDWVNSVVFSPDENTLVSGSDDGTVRVWDVAVGRHKTTLEAHVRSVKHVAFSPDGSLLASLDSKEVRLWNTATWQRTATFAEPMNNLTSLAFCFDGRALAIGGANSVRVWDFNTENIKTTIPGESRNLAFSDDSRTLAIHSDAISLWNLDPSRWALTSSDAATDPVISVPPPTVPDVSVTSPTNPVVSTTLIDTTDPRYGLEIPDNMVWLPAQNELSTYFFFGARVSSLTGAPPGADVEYEECEIKLHIPDESIYFILPVTTQTGRRIKAGADIGTAIINVLGALNIPKVSQAAGIAGAIIAVTDAWDSTVKAFADDLRIKLPNNLLEKPEASMPFIVMTIPRMDSVSVTVKQVVKINGGESQTLTANGLWDLSKDVLAAPIAQPSALTDWSPFQLLSPHAQQGLLQLSELVNSLTRSTSATRETQLPEKTSLLANYPNPFNPETWIPYQLAKPADVTLTLYDIQGRVVRHLDLGHQRAGMYHSRSRAAYWDGRNAQGEPVASGVYFYTLKAGDFTATRKMLIRK